MYVIIERISFDGEAVDIFSQLLGRLSRCASSALPPASMDSSRDRGASPSQGWSRNYEEDWSTYALCCSNPFPRVQYSSISDKDPGAGY